MPDFTTIRQNAQPLDFLDERLVVGDTTEFLEKMLRYMTELEVFSAAINDTATDMNSLGNELSDADVIQARLKNRLTYETLSGLVSAGAPPNAGTDLSELAEVWNDTTNNGLYGWNGTEWIVSTVYGETIRTVVERLEKGLYLSNLHSPDENQIGYYLNNSGVFLPAANWVCTAFIPVSEGLSYNLTYNGTRRAGISFFSSKDPSSFISGSYDSGLENPKVITVPEGANFIVFNLVTPSGVMPTQIQFAEGEDIKQYSETSYLIRESTLPPRSLEVIEAFLNSFARVNLHRPLQNQIDTYMVTSGSAAILPADGWECSEFIPVESGKSYTLSFTGNRLVGVAFYTGFTSDTYVAGSFVGESTNPLTVLAPPGAKYVVFNLKSDGNPAPTNVMFEEGISSSPYVEDLYRLDSNSLPLSVSATVEQFLIREADYLARQNALIPTVEPLATTVSNTLVLSQAESYIKVKVENVLVKIGIDPYLPLSSDRSNAFNFTYLRAHDDQIIKPAVDDIAPYRTLGTTIGANHGYKKNRCVVNGHGKTTVDIGSVYSDGTSEWVLISIPDANTLDITQRIGNGAAANNTNMAHVSGGSNLGLFSTGSVTILQWYPCFKNHIKEIRIDSNPNSLSEGSYLFNDRVVVTESYDIMEKSAVVEWLVSNVGNSEINLEYDAEASISISIQYVFDQSGSCTIYSDFYALKDVSSFQDIMFVMAMVFADTTFGDLRCYVPKSLPFTHEGTAYDFNRVEDFSAFTTVGVMNFTPDRCDPLGILCDRALQMNDDIGLAIGYLPLKDADPSVRRTNAPVKALQISPAKKIYMSCIDGLQSSLTQGDYFSAIAYRTMFIPGSDRLANYVVESNDAYYLYCDWQAGTVDRVFLPVGIAGKVMTLIEKSPTVEVLTQSTSSILFKTTGVGYFVARFDK